MKLLETSNEPKITQTSPPGQREGHERYSAEVSMAILILASLSHQTVRMRMEIYPLPKPLDDGHHPRAKLNTDDRLEVSMFQKTGQLFEKA